MIWESVVVLGRFRELPVTGGNDEARSRAQSMLERRGSWWQAGYAASQIRTSPGAHAAIFYQIEILEMTGLRGSPGDRLIERIKMKS